MIQKITLLSLSVFISNYALASSADIMQDHSSKSILLILLILLSYAAFKLQRKKQKSLSNEEHILKIVSALKLDHKNSIMVVDFDGKRTLIGTGEGGPRMLDSGRQPKAKEAFSNCLSKDKGEKRYELN